MSASTLIIALIASLALFSCAIAEQSSQSEAINALDERQEQQQLQARHNSRLLAVPHTLARILLYNARAHQQATADRQQQQQQLQQLQHELSNQLTQQSPTSYKRSSSSLDALTGMTLGKRSVQQPTQLDFINLELPYGQQKQQPQQAAAYGLRSPMRLFWSPIGYEPTSHRFEDLY